MIQWFAAIALASAAVAPAQAQMVRAQDVQSVASALSAGGLTAKMGTDKLGDPYISSAIGGTNFQIYFYNCTDHRNCATVQFHAGYDLSGVTLESINRWNKEQRFGRAFLDGEGDPILEMDIDLDDGGISQLLFIDNLEFWTSLVATFEKHIGYR